MGPFLPPQGGKEVKRHVIPFNEFEKGLYFMSNTASDPTIAQNLPLTIHAQYVKDLSFENPGAPGTLALTGAGPHMDVSINLAVSELPKAEAKDRQVFEVVTELRVRATKDGKPLFFADIDYALAVSLGDMPDNLRHPVLLIEVPKLGFPFVRQILSDLVTGGGFPPLLLTPVDFASLYMERFGTKGNA